MREKHLVGSRFYKEGVLEPPPPPHPPIHPYFSLSEEGVAIRDEGWVEIVSYLGEIIGNWKWFRGEKNKDNCVICDEWVYLGLRSITMEKV